MQEYPIIFSGEMVRAILEGRKTQTRRVIKPQPILGDSGCWYPSEVPGDFRNKTGLHYANETHMRRGMAKDFSPYGKPGDHLWVREAWKTTELPDTGLDGISYKADDSFIPIANTEEAAERWMDAEECIAHSWRPSIHMPRWASRITLEIVNVRVERLQEISQIDAAREGILIPIGKYLITETAEEYIQEFKELWDKLNAKRGFGWEVNPYVWVIEFKKLPMT